jgi:hypothetical protein
MSLTEKEQSEFNMSIQYLGRLNTLFYTCNESRINLDLYTWYHTLLALRSELIPEMNNEEIKEIKKLIEIITPVINQHIILSKSTGNQEINPDIYFLLDDLEQKIRIVLKTSGLQLKMKDSPTKALR